VERSARRTAEISVFVASLLAALLPARLRAQPAPAPALSPPVLIEAAEAAYPQEARAQGLEATVLLQLTIDAEGRVAEASVLEAAGHGFDEAAQEAALRFRFEPAKRDGVPVGARIRYPYAFHLPVPATESATESESESESESEPESVTESESVSASVSASAAESASESPPAHRAVEVTVHGALSDAARLQQSADAVNVVDLRRARQQTADMGEVLARTQGVSIRRSAGLGSDARFSLNGLYDDQIRFFLDGVPLELAGYSFGITDVPVNLTERVEIYRGVVPIRLGADALGGAVNVVTDQSYRTHAAASYQLGSFGTRRLTLEGRYHDDASGFVAGGSAFLDTTRNDYDVDVEIPDARGQLHPATVRRFHDGYEAYGATLEAGVVDRPWAKRLLLRGFASTYDKELQNNMVMTVPYGEVAYGETVYGGTLRYEVALSPSVDLEVIANHAYRAIDYVDKATWVYNWRGERVRMRRVPGEVEGDATDQTLWQHSSFGRVVLGWTLAPGHVVRASVSPTFTTRTGDERIESHPGARDPLSARRELLTVVSGVAYELDVLDERLSNVAFVKDYVYDADSEESLPGNIFVDRKTDIHRLGAGDSLRYRFTPFLYAKASYEFATRLPRPDELFGNGVLVMANLGLLPEISHNANLGPHVDLPRTPLGEFTIDVNAFLRDSDRLIVLLGNDKVSSYQNVYRAVSMGLENAVSWVSPGRFVGVDGMLTWQDLRNASDQGTFADFKGDRIPNRPYLFASWGARLRFAGMPGRSDTIEPFYNGRYVHAFFRGWESQGLRQFKQVVDAQVTHAVGVSWLFNRDVAHLATTLEIDNVTDVKAFDEYGAQRPGRAFYLKFSGDI
jgi:TonB family protein